MKGSGTAAVEGSGLKGSVFAPHRMSSVHTACRSRSSSKHASTYGGAKGAKGAAFGREGRNCLGHESSGNARAQGCCLGCEGSENTSAKALAYTRRAVVHHCASCEGKNTGLCKSGSGTARHARKPSGTRQQGKARGTAAGAGPVRCRVRPPTGPRRAAPWPC